jgi:Family of unknown function (DUF5670)
VNHVTFDDHHIRPDAGNCRKFDKKLERGPVLIRSTYILAGILSIGWLMGNLIFHAGPAVHLLLLAAMLAAQVNIIREG